MKSWIKKFKISAALDEARPSERAPEPPVQTCPDDMSRFAASLHRLDHQLKNARPHAAAPDDLHESIMHRVRQAGRKAEARTARPSFRWSWLAAPGLALLALMGWMVWPEKSRPASNSAVSAHSLKVATSTFEMGRSAAQTAPAAALAPLENEMTLLHSDALRAMDLVFASLPQDALAFVERGETRSPR